MIFHRKDGKFRTQQFTIMTIQTVVVLDHWGMISLLVEFRREHQDLPGAELDTVATSLAAIGNDNHFSPGYRNIRRIQRLTPVFHKTCPVFSASVTVANNHHLSISNKIATEKLQFQDVKGDTPVVFMMVSPVSDLLSLRFLDLTF